MVVRRQSPDVESRLVCLRTNRARRAGPLLAGLWLGACGARSGLELDPIEQRPDSMGVSPARPEPRFSEASLAPEETLDDEPTGCVDIARRYSSTPPTVILLIDQSASMNSSFGASTRWDVLRQSIIEPNDGLLAWLDQNANIGLTLYTSLDGFSGGRECPLLDGVDVRLGDAETIRGFYASAEPMPGGDTPTADAIDASVATLLALRTGPARYVLLLTDGVPDTCAEPDPQNGFEQAVGAVERAYREGVVVFTVGVSPAIARRGLQRMANASAGKPLDLVFGTDADAVEPLYASTEPRELAAQLKGVIGDVRSCTIELGKRIGDARTLDGRVVLDGAPLVHDDANGWSFVDDDTIRVHGNACNRVLGNGQILEVRFPCIEPTETELY
jgi:hypothetical protein